MAAISVGELLCDEQMKAVTQCLANTPSEQCSCNKEITGMEMLYPLVLDDLFDRASPNSNPEFCDHANENICEN